MPARLIVMASGSGTLLQALLDAAQAPSYPAQVVAVISDRPDCQALQRAVDHGVAAHAVVMADFGDRAGWDLTLAETVAECQPDLIVLAGFMKILSPTFLQRFPGRVINSHPALLPAFPGAHAVRDALNAGVEVTGASVIWVDEGVDTGELIAQREVPVVEEDDESSLHARIKAAEREMLVHVVADLVTPRTLSSEGHRLPDHPTGAAPARNVRT